MMSSTTTPLHLSGDYSREHFLQQYQKFFSLTTVFVTAVPGFAPLKLLAIVSLCVYLLLVGSISMPAALWLISVTFNILIGIDVGVIQDVPLHYALDHGVRIYLFFVSLAIGGFAATHLTMTKRRLDSLIFLIAAVLMAFKLIIVAAVLSGVSLERMQALFGFDTVTSDIGFGLSRLQFPSDIMVPFLIACYRGGEKRWKDAVLLICIITVTLLSFSRYLFGFYLLCTLVRACWIRKIDFITALNIGISVACIAIFFQTLLSRFASAETSMSDQIRVDQIHYLKIGIHNFPLLGTGLGSEAHDYLRSDKYPFFYEAQWYATTMQMGYVGVTWYVLNLLLALYVSLRRHPVLFSVVFLAWVAAGFTNPFLTALGSAFGLSLLLLRCNGEGSNPVRTTSAV